MDHFWEGLDGNIFNMILGDCQTKSRPIRTYKRPLFDHFFWRLDGNRLKMIPRVYWTTSRPFWTYKRRLFFLFFLQGLDGNIFNMIPDVEETRGQFCIPQCLSCLLHFAFTEICCSHEGVPQGLPMCYLLTKRLPTNSENLFDMQGSLHN